MKTKTRILIILVSCFFSLNISAALASEVIKIGVISSFKVPPGEALLNSAKMATEDINSKGGIAGRKIDLILANDEYKPEKGVMAYRKLVLEDKCDVVFGTISSGVAKAIMDQMARYEKLFISTGAASDALSDQYNLNREKYKYWFRISNLSSEQSQIYLNIIYKLPVKKYGAKRMAIVSENALWAREATKDALKFFKEHGLEVVYSEPVDSETKDFTTILTKIINAKADFIYENLAHIDGSIYIKQWYDLKGPMTAGANAAASSSRYWKDCGGKAVSEMVFYPAGTLPIPNTPKTIPFYNRFLDTFKDYPGYASGNTYDAFYIYKEAVERAKTTDSKALIPALEKTDYLGVVGRWAFEDNHNPKCGEGYRQYLALQWREDGSRVCVYPESLATGEFLPPPWWKK